MAEHLFLFSINPVQSYIEQARKTQDLYAGSMILSRLCRTAMTASKLPPEQIIFPQADLTTDTQSLPNRWIGIVTEEEYGEMDGKDDEEKLRNFGKQIEEAVQSEFHQMAEKVCEPFQAQVPAGFFEQINNYLDINWLALPYQEAEYVNIYPRLERLLKGIKQVRTFGLEPEKGRKCAICGERNVKIYRRNTHEQARETLLRY